MTTALITGATGFIGQYLLRDLLALGWRCRVLSRADRPELARSGVEVVRGDITNRSSLRGALDDIEFVFHLAGAGHVAAVSAEAHAHCRAVNVDGVANLLEVCREQPVRKLVHFSSTAAMGLIKADVLDEDSPPQPRTPYQLSKYEGEAVVRRAWQEWKVPAVIVRPCMVYGPGGTGEFAKICRWMAKGIFPRVGRGPSYTPLIHVRDVALGARLAAERGRPGEVYLLVGESLPVAEVRRSVLQALHVQRPFPYVPLRVAVTGAGMIEWATQRLGKVPPVSRANIISMATGRRFNIDKARHELGFEPQCLLADNAAEVLSWLKAQGKV
jgi:nucleoside-diphosphate-sugar epimerase